MEKNDNADQGVIITEAQCALKVAECILRKGISDIQ